MSDGTAVTATAAVGEAAGVGDAFTMAVGEVFTIAVGDTVTVDVEIGDGLVHPAIAMIKTINIVAIVKFIFIGIHTENFLLFLIRLEINKRLCPWQLLLARSGSKKAGMEYPSRIIGYLPAERDNCLTGDHQRALSRIVFRNSVCP